ncbi:MULTISPECIES: maltose acetyltransferase domain-containing protein [unclassified Bacillus (in: firmicutes)]|uniref:maltose acetyltransferase domain-containing protein n=1 Tax=unclassified Bacillus (in: firmicutes) TaxID=185979 RepID=UPI000D034413|nr:MULTISPECIES: maltose acetyltransferase domain-containing protein [unclassified Bacillus (in: firmicutes)]PRS83404.1 hypothetical protein C6346_04400 [Bacillus sp. CJCL2]PRS88151.1 hypothetical protein C6348_04400 [Bacillus sp. YBWC18]
MIQGEHYVSSDQTLIADRERARQLNFAYQQTNQPEKRTSILKELLGACGNDVVFEERLQCDYGYNIEVGKHFAGILRKSLNILMNQNLANKHRILFFFFFVSIR